MPYPRLIGLVLCGGQGSRMHGVNKGLQLWHGRALIAHVVARLQPQVATVWLSANRDLDAYGRYSDTVLSDRGTSVGPLSGILSALHHAQSLGLSAHCQLLIVPVDMPLLPLDLAQTLLADRPDTPTPCFIQDQPLLLCLPLACCAPLQDYIDSGQRQVRGAWQALGGRSTPAAPHWQAQAALANLNTMQDLALPQPTI